MLWPPDAVGLARQLRSQGQPYSQIAAEIERQIGFVVTASAVRGRVHRDDPAIGKQRLQAKRAQNAAAYKLLGGLLSAGMSRVEVAKIGLEHGVSRTKTYELCALDQRRDQRSINSDVRQRDRLEARIAPAALPDHELSANLRDIERALLAIRKPDAVDTCPIVDHGRTIMELRETDCRWPIGRDATGAILFCILQKDGTKSSYCARHHEMSTIPARPVDRCRRPPAAWSALCRLRERSG